MACRVHADEKENRTDRRADEAGQSSGGELAHRSSAIYTSGRQLKNIPAARAVRCGAAEAFAFSPDAHAARRNIYVPT